MTNYKCTMSFLSVLIAFSCQFDFVKCQNSYMGEFQSPYWSISNVHRSRKATHTTFTVALKLRNVDDMINSFLKVSNPLDNQYGKFFTIDQVKQKYGPTIEEQESVLSFFKKIKDSNVELNLLGDLIRVTAKITHVEEALETELGWHTSKLNPDVEVLRVLLPIRIPSNITSSISFISLNSPISHPVPFIAQQDRRVSQDERDNRQKKFNYNPSANAPVTLRTVARHYKMPMGYKARLGSQAVAEFYGEFFSNDDLNHFLALHGQHNASIPSSNIFGDLPDNPSHPGGEASLDVQYLMGLAPGVPTYMYSMSDKNPYSSENEGFLAYLYIVGNQTSPPLVHSMSYGDIEAAIFTDVPGASEYGFRVEMEFVKMGLRGLSIIFASGDNGISNFLNNDQKCKKAWPDWPASSPYVTAVGGTQFSEKFMPICSMLDCQDIAEVVCSGGTGGVITSGGGFSEMHSRSHAPWQHDVVSRYLSFKDKIPPTTYFNASGRGYPDVSALAFDYFVIGSRSVWYESGTSASTPVFASMVSLWNDMRLSAGKAPMGFLNPFLYTAAKEHPEAFNDITVGDNACRVGFGGCCPNKFTAAPGWDAATGLGSPNFDILAKLVMEYA